MGPEQMAQALAAGACDYAMPDAERIGGVTGWMRAAALAQGAGIEMSSHLFPGGELPPARRRRRPATGSNTWTGPTRCSRNRRGSRSGHVQIPDRPGLGMALGRESGQALRPVMFTRHFPHWPPGVAEVAPVPDTSLYYNLEVSARRYPDKAAFPTTARAFPTPSCSVRRRAGRLPAARLRRGQGRPRAALHAEQPAVHHRLLRHPARRRGGGAGQPDEQREELRYIEERRRRSAGRSAIEPEPLGGGARTACSARLLDYYLREATDLNVPDFVRARSR